MANAKPDLAAALAILCERTIAGWSANPDLVEKDAREEQNLLSTGYHDRQIFELVQNAADAARQHAKSRIELRVSERYLYAANTGDPISEAGLRALILGGVSPKGGEEIGRFGLGFRSLLRLGGKVDVFSGNAAFRFDPEWCAQKAREAARLSESADAPSMRLARAINRQTEVQSDSILGDQTGWADTVIRAELANRDAIESMSRELEGFPAEFLLFQEPDTSVDIVLNDSQTRRISRVQHGNRCVLKDGDEESIWDLFSKRFEITDPAARRDAGKLQGRDAATIIWAVPERASDLRSGNFWNAFPTRTSSVVPGILDARWKLNSDRSNLTGESWNLALMKCAAKLVAENLPALSTREDPGRPFSALPRMYEKSEPASPLGEALWSEVLNTRFVANSHGQLKFPADLYVPPVSEPDLLNQWVALADATDSTNFVHESCISTRERSSRLVMLSRFVGDHHKIESAESDDDEADLDEEKPNLERMELDDWMLLLATTQLPRARSVIEFIASAAQKNIDLAKLAPDLKLIPTSTGDLWWGRQLLFPAVESSDAQIRTVDPQLAADQSIREILKSIFKVGDLDDAKWFEILTQVWRSAAISGAEKACDLLVLAPLGVQEQFVQKHKDLLRIKNRTGNWVKVHGAILPGRIVGEDEASDHLDVLVDQNFANACDRLLKLCGVSDVPAMDIVVDSYGELIADAKEAFRVEYRKRRGAARALDSSLSFIDGVAALGGIGLLKRIKDSPCAKLTELLLSLLSSTSRSADKHNLSRPLKFGGRGSSVTESRYPPLVVPNPNVWTLWKYGRVQIGALSIPIPAVAQFYDELKADELPGLSFALEGFNKLRNLLPADWSMPKAPSSIVWSALLDPRSFIDPAAELATWKAAARRGLAPARIRGVDGTDSMAISQVYVTRSERDCAFAISAGLRCVMLDRNLADVWISKGALEFSGAVVFQFGSPVQNPWPLFEFLPGLREFSDSSEFPVMVVQSIERRLGAAKENVRLAYREDGLYLSQTWVEAATKSELLRGILEEIEANLNLREPLESVIAKLDSDVAEKLRADVRACPDLPARLIAAVGGGIERLGKIMPVAASRALTGSESNRQIAELFLDIYGAGALREISDAMEEVGLKPPGRWGTDEAAQFVSSLGFPANFAGAANPRLVPEIYVPGPHPLPKLHDYQSASVTELLRFLGSDLDRRRAVLSLPTGAGKTRVAVEAAVRSVLTGRNDRPLVVWVAQTIELAEQAVEAFRHVWQTEGAEEAELRIVRFWGGQKTPQDIDSRKPVVIVALIQTIEGRLPRNEAQWLASASLVVIDESHHAIAPTYTSLLNQLGISTGAKQRAQGKPAQREPALLGLSATPFRSSGEDESRRLASRFEAVVIPHEQDGLYANLRTQGILSVVTMDPLRIDQPFSLDEVERKHFEQYGELPDSAMRRLAGQDSRNEAIVSAVERADQKSVLLFANSIDHSMELAARLSLRGIRSRTVSGQTDRSSRQEAVSSFRRGDVRVICNAAVFATGFDAPSVDMVLIARPVFSPVRFMQMVGRGLRGAKNGGTEMCRILTVQDNIVGYADRDPVKWWRQYYE